MKKSISFLILFVLFSSVSSFADSLVSEGSLATYVEMKSAEGDFDPAAAMAAFAEGSPGTAAVLTGSWILVGSALVIPEPMAGAIRPYTPDGVKNDDGTFFNQLQMETVTDFYGNQIFVTKVLNLGNDRSDQGPFPVTLAQSSGRSGQYRAFPQNLYGGTAQLENQCRIVKGFTDRMVCAGVYRNRSQASSSFSKYDGQSIVIRGFLKQAL